MGIIATAPSAVNRKGTEKKYFGKMRAPSGPEPEGVPWIRKRNSPAARNSVASRPGRKRQRPGVYGPYSLSPCGRRTAWNLRSSTGCSGPETAGQGVEPRRFYRTASWGILFLLHTAWSLPRFRSSSGAPQPGIPEPPLEPERPTPACSSSIGRSLQAPRTFFRKNNGPVFRRTPGRLFRIREPRNPQRESGCPPDCRYIRVRGFRPGIPPGRPGKPAPG